MNIANWLIKRTIEKWIKKQKGKPMGKFLDWMKGKRTIFTCIVIATLGGIGALNQAGVTNIEIPDIVFTALGALGIYTRTLAKK